MSSRSSSAGVRRPRPIASPPKARGQLPPVLLRAGQSDAATRTALLVQLQQTCGNRQVQRLIAPYQVSRETPAGPADPPPPEALGSSIVEDDATEVGPGQMRRSAFLAALRSEVDAEVSALGPMAEADAHAHLPRAFADLESQDAASLERSLRANLRGTSPSDARSYITAATSAVRVRFGGQGGGGAAGGGSGPTGVVGRLLGSLGGLASALFKARDGRASAGDAKAIRAQLGPGQPLDTGARSTGETAYGQDLSQVRVHNDASASELANQVGARAFTVGNDIAFAPGEYRPGNLVGDALIAHELAHVTQQARSQPARHDSSGEGKPVSDLEEEADRAAVGAVISRWADVGGRSIEGTMPRLRAGLRLQRCATATQQRPAAQPGPQSCTTLTPEQWRTAVEAARQLSGAERSRAMTELARQALCDIGITVQEAGTSHTDTVHPDDYAEVPVINFDANLNSKTRWRGAGGGPMGDNVGYNFSAGSRNFAIIGPSSLNPNTPLTTRMYAQHELYLRSLPSDGSSSADLELQSWTRNFRNYFHQFLALPIPQRPSWTPLVGYYERASEEARTQAIDGLVEYYNSPPEDAERVQRQIRSWMRRRSGQLITDLNGALPSE